MGELKKQLMELEEKLVERAFQEWEIEKMIRTMSLGEIEELIKKIDQEVIKRKESSGENSATS